MIFCLKERCLMLMLYCGKLNSQFGGGFLLEILQIPTVVFLICDELFYVAYLFLVGLESLWCFQLVIFLHRIRISLVLIFNISLA